MEAPQVLRTDSQLLSEQFSVPLKTARQTLNSCNNDLAKAGKKLLHSLFILAKPMSWRNYHETKSTPKQHEIASVSWKYNDLANSQELVVCFDATSTLALEKAYNNQEDGLILTSSREDSYVDLKRMLITTTTSTKSIYREIIEPRSMSFLPPKQWRSSEVVCTSIDSTTRQLVSGHVDGTLATWTINPKGKLKLVHNMTSKNAKIICMDTYQNWSVYLMQTDQTMNMYLKPPKNIKENPSFIASASVKKFGCSKHSRCGCLRNASVALIASTTKNEPPSIVVGMKGGIQRIYFVNPHLWDVKKKGNPVKHQSNWIPTNVKTNHQSSNIVSHIHIVQNVVMISCDQRINFISLLPNNTYGTNMTVADKEPVKYGEWTDAGSGIMSYKRYEPTEYRSKTEIGVVVAIDHYIQKNKCLILIASACNEIRRFEISASNELEYIETYDLSSLPPIHSLAILNHTDDSSELCLGTETGRSYITISTNTNQKKKEQKSWLEQQSKKENNIISLVLPGSKEYNGVLTEYDRAYMGRGGSPQGEIHIQNVYRVQNFELYQRYKSFIKNKSSTSTNNNRTTSVLNTALGDTALEAINKDEKRLFHGTSSSVVRGILNQGFDFRLAGKHGSVHGAGVNFARDSTYSLNYVNRGQSNRGRGRTIGGNGPRPVSQGGFSFGGTQPSTGSMFGGGGFGAAQPSTGGMFGGGGFGAAQPSTGGFGFGFGASQPSHHDDAEEKEDCDSCCMFLARVYVGKATRSNGAARRPPPIDPNDPSGKLFDTTVDSVSNPNIHVIYDNHQAYPEYIIELNSNVIDSNSNNAGFGLGSTSSQSSKVCRNWQQGHCQYGQSCRYLHPTRSGNTYQHTFVGENGLGRSKKKYISITPCDNKKGNETNLTFIKNKNDDNGVFVSSLCIPDGKKKTYEMQTQCITMNKKKKKEVTKNNKKN